MCISTAFWPGKVTLGLIVLFFASVLPLQLIKAYDIVGTIRLTKKEIIIDDSQRQYSFSILDITGLEVFALEVAGEFYGGKSLMMKQGTSNYLKFKEGGKKREYMFLLEESSVSDLRNLLRAWRDAGVVYILHNRTWQRLKR
ncbi:hypothetical protein [Chitinophaga sp.]|uniref:hypothetical protein n=1 Tax=Chitinophaga sp. TaxID=1869181 RepID=UPI0031D14399